MSEIYKEIKWECPKCKHENTDPYLDIETHPVQCKKCNNEFDVYLKVKLDVEVIKVSDGNCSEEEKENILKRLNGSNSIHVSANIMNTELQK